MICINVFIYVCTLNCSVNLLRAILFYYKSLFFIEYVGMCVGMCVCIYVCIFVRMYECMHVHIHVCMRVCIPYTFVLFSGGAD